MEPDKRITPLIKVNAFYTNINLNPAIGLEQIRRDKANRSAGNHGRCENDIRINQHLLSSSINGIIYT